MMLTLNVLLLSLAIAALFAASRRHDQHIALISSAIAMLISLVILSDFDTTVFGFQLLSSTVVNNAFNINFTLGVDGVSVLFYILSALLSFLCLVYIWTEPRFKEYAIYLLGIELFLLLIFSTNDLLVFYVFFESILIPMFLMIGVYGSRERKIRAGYLFFFYTLCSSLLFLLAILYLFDKVGTFDFNIILAQDYTLAEQLVILLCFSLSFASKLPMWPLHIWLPEAHVEAPTVGSVLLAGILLKLGVYGFLRFGVTMLDSASQSSVPLIYILSLVGIVFASLIAVRQTDLKRIIAYSSVAHMNLVALGIFALNVIGFEGAIIQSLSHGFVSGGMFLIVGIVYSRYHTRQLQYYGGLTVFMPVYVSVFLVLTMANIALPGTSSFIGEALLLTGVFKSNIFIAAIATTGVILAGTYSLWLYNKMAFGNLKISYTTTFQDLDLKEFLIFFVLLVFVLILGILPNTFLDYLHHNSDIMAYTALMSLNGTVSSGASNSVSSSESDIVKSRPKRKRGRYSLSIKSRSRRTHQSTSDQIVQDAQRLDGQDWIFCHLEYRHQDALLAHPHETTFYPANLRAFDRAHLTLQLALVMQAIAGACGNMSYKSKTINVGPASKNHERFKGLPNILIPRKHFIRSWHGCDDLNTRINPQFVPQILRTVSDLRKRMVAIPQCRRIQVQPATVFGNELLPLLQSGLVSKQFLDNCLLLVYFNPLYVGLTDVDRIAKQRAYLERKRAEHNLCMHAQIKHWEATKVIQRGQIIPAWLNPLPVKLQASKSKIKAKSKPKFTT